MTKPDPGLSIENLCFSYPDYPGFAARELFSKLNLKLPACEIAVVLARPDQGKTTLCRVLGGLLPRFSGGRVSGQVRLGTTELLEYPPYDLIEQVGLIFQQPGEQLLASRCDSEIAFPLESLGIDRSEIENRLQAALRTMDLERYRFQSPKNLSGGEKKKLLIACLLAVDPGLWLLDETLEELDRTTKETLLRLLKNRRRSTLILSAKWHDLFRRYVDKVFLLEDGRIRGVEESMGSTGFEEMLLSHGFELPKNGLVQKPKITDAEPLLVAENLHFSYGGESPAAAAAFSLKINHLRLHFGQTVALVGDNGSGKSTLARILCGLLLPEQGMVRIRKAGVLQPAAADDLNRFSGYLFQDPDLQIFLPTVFEELALGLKHLGLPDGELRQRVKEAVSLFNLPSTETPPSLMSYGARKKLQAAVYYLLHRPLMIIDEGDSGLSVDEFADMVRIFRKSSETLIFITHDRRLAESLADEVVVLKHGSLL